MSKTSKTDVVKDEIDTAPAPVGKDEALPDVDDDADPAPAAAARADEETGDEVRKPERHEPETGKEDGRARAVRLFRERRDKEEAEARAKAQQQPEQPAGDPDPEPVDPEAGNEETEPDGEPEGEIENHQPKDKSKPSAQKTVMLVVDGKLEEVSLEEAIKLAQIAKASDNRLEEAKRAVKEAREFLETARGTRGQDDPENPPARTAKQSHSQPDPSKGQSDPEHRPGKRVDPEKLRQITERIQVGDADEGANAMAELVELVTQAAPVSNPDETNRQVRQVLAHQKHKEELDAALDKFSKDYPEVVKDDLLADAGMTVLRREVIKDLKTAGVADEDIKSISGSDELLIRAHRDLKVAGHPVRSYDALFDTAGKTLSEKFNIKRAGTTPPQPSPTKPAQQRAVAEPDKVQARVERKRAAPQQPRAVGVRQQVAPPPQQRTTRDIVRQMRKGRGFSLSD